MVELTLKNNGKIERSILKKLDIITDLVFMRFVEGYEKGYCPICKKTFELPFRTHYYLKHGSLTVGVKCSD